MRVLAAVLHLRRNWVSAATILGYTGNVFENGTSVIAVTVIPWFIGAGLLYLISGRIYDCDLLTIPQFIGDRYHSRLLRTCCALLLSSGYVFYLVIQIKGIWNRGGDALKY